MIHILVIIPAYNEQNTILATVERLKSTPFDPECQMDYVVVNDGSADRTLDVLRQNGLRYLNLPMNVGIGGGVQLGYQYAFENGYDCAVQLDGDGQHDPAYIADLIRPLLDGTADMTVGSRFIEKVGFQSSGMRQVGIRILSNTIRLLCGKRIYDVTSGFRACNREMIALFSKQYAQDYPEPEAIIFAVKNGYRVQEVPVVMSERQGGVSSISGFKSVYYMLKVELALIVRSMQKRRKTS